MNLKSRYRALNTIKKVVFPCSSCTECQLLIVSESYTLYVIHNIIFININI